MATIVILYRGAVRFQEAVSGMASFFFFMLICSK